MPLAAGSSGGASARQAALEAGVREAVERAAVDLASQAGASASQDSVRAALGTDLLVYASQFRILEDRGERTPLLEQSPAAEREYVVTVETHVDRSRLRSRLQQAGLLGAPAQPGARRALRIAFDGVDSYPLWKRIERTLGARGGAVRPLEFARGRIVAEVETRRTAARSSGGSGPGSARTSRCARSGWTATCCWWRLRRARRRSRRRSRTPPRSRPLPRPRLVDEAQPNRY